MQGVENFGTTKSSSLVCGKIEGKDMKGKEKKKKKRWGQRSKERFFFAYFSRLVAITSLDMSV